MNIFVLDLNHEQNVQYYIDRHIVKQIVESGQMLCTARKIVGDGCGKYRITHKNHPCNIWLRQSSENYKWLCELALAMSNEYNFRYGKRHKTTDVILDCYNNIPKVNGEFTLPPSCMKENFIVGENVVDNYRNYYIYDKVFDKNGKLMAKWTKRLKPDWFKDIYGML